MAKMDEPTLRALVNAEIKAAAGGGDTRLSLERRRSIQYYRGTLPVSTGIDGRSAVVSRDVAEAIDQTMPPLMEIFETTTEICRFEPRVLYGMQADEVKRRCGQAAEATEDVNAEWRRADDGYLATYSWIHDSLRFRNGIIKIWWDDTPHITKERYIGLSDLSAQMLAENEQVEIVEMTSRPDPDAAAALMVAQMAGGPMQAMPDGAPIPPPVPQVHDVVVRRTNMLGRVRIANVPLDEFLISPRSSKIERNPFSGHRYLESVGTLIERFPDRKDAILNLPAANDDAGLERTERYADADTMSKGDPEEFDPSRRRVWVCEAFILADYDGDDIAEMRSIITAGGNNEADLILENEEVDDNAFCSITPYPEPHAFWGGSVTEKVEDVQDVKTVLTRGALDTVYNANAPQMAVDPARVDLDDLLMRRPGGVVRTQGDPATALYPIPTLPVAADAYQMIAMFDAVREQRTGIRRFAQGPGADALNNAYTDTATGAMLVDDSSKERIRYIARNCAETGFKRAMRMILKLKSMHCKTPLMVPRGKDYVAIDPREWDTEMTMTVTVGLGTGSQQKLAQVMTQLLNLDAQIIGLQKGLGGPLLNAENVYNKLEKLIEYAGLKTADPYYMNPANAPQGQQQPPPPDPEAMKAQAQIAIQQQKAQVDAQTAQAKAQLDAQLAQHKAGLDAQLAQAKLAADLDAQRQQAALEMELGQRRAEHQMQIDMMRAQHQAQIDTMKAQNEAADDRRDAALGLSE